MIYKPTHIDEQLTSDLLLFAPELRSVQQAGFIRQVFNPSTRKAILATGGFDNDEPMRPFTIDTVNYDVQLGHLLNGGTPIVPAQRYGSRTENRYNLQLTLLVATTRPDLLPVILDSLSNVQELHVTEFFANTLAVLQREFLFVPNPSQSYDPRLSAYAIRYTCINYGIGQAG